MAALESRDGSSPVTPEENNEGTTVLSEGEKTHFLHLLGNIEFKRKYKCRV